MKYIDAKITQSPCVKISGFGSVALTYPSPAAGVLQRNTLKLAQLQCFPEYFIQQRKESLGSLQKSTKHAGLLALETYNNAGTWEGASLEHRDWV